MPAENPLSKLKDIHLPPAVSFWPPAPGWWVLALLFVILMAFCGWWLWNMHKRKRPRTEGLRMLKEMQNQYHISGEALATLRNLSQLIRRTALTFYAQVDVASLHGSSWLEFLDKTGQTTEFTKGAGKILGAQLYQQKPDFDMEALFPVVNKWLAECPHKI